MYSLPVSVVNRCFVLSIPKVVSLVLIALSFVDWQIESRVRFGVEFGEPYLSRQGNETQETAVYCYDSERPFYGETSLSSIAQPSIPRHMLVTLDT